MPEMEELLARVRAQQKRLIARYERQRYFVGEPVEVPREGELPARFYVNRPQLRPEGRMKVFFNLHGGGFTGGDARQMGTFCQKLADRLGLFVVNVNYRLSPDFVYPYQCGEIDAIWRWLEENAQRLGVDVAHCGIGGFSAGATIALSSVARRLRRGLRGYTCCVLVYPYVTPDAGELDRDSAYPVGGEDELRVLNYYFDGREREPECCLLSADEALLARFPAVVEITCGRDALDRQGKKLAARLAGAGARLNYAHYPRALHGFVEVNRDDYDAGDPRRSPEQAALCAEAEEFIIHGLKNLL